MAISAYATGRTRTLVATGDVKFLVDALNLTYGDLGPYNTIKPELFGIFASASLTVTEYTTPTFYPPGPNPGGIPYTYQRNFRAVLSAAVTDYHSYGTGTTGNSTPETWLGPLQTSTQYPWSGDNELTAVLGSGSVIGTLTVTATMNEWADIDQYVPFAEKLASLSWTLTLTASGVGAAIFRTIGAGGGLAYNSVAPSSLTLTLSGSATPNSLVDNGWYCVGALANCYNTAITGNVGMTGPGISFGRTQTASIDSGLVTATVNSITANPVVPYGSPGSTGGAGFLCSQPDWGLAVNFTEPDFFSGAEVSVTRFERDDYQNIVPVGTAPTATSTRKPTFTSKSYSRPTSGIMWLLDATHFDGTQPPAVVGGSLGEPLLFNQNSHSVIPLTNLSFWVDETWANAYGTFLKGSSLYNKFYPVAVGPDVPVGTITVANSHAFNVFGATNNFVIGNSAATASIAGDGSLQFTGNGNPGFYVTTRSNGSGYKWKPFGYRYYNLVVKSSVANQTVSFRMNLFQSDGIHNGWLVPQWNFTLPNANQYYTLLIDICMPSAFSSTINISGQNVFSSPWEVIHPLFAFNEPGTYNIEFSVGTLGNGQTVNFLSLTGFLNTTGNRVPTLLYGPLSGAGGGDSVPAQASPVAPRQDWGYSPLWLYDTEPQVYDVIYDSNGNMPGPVGPIPFRYFANGAEGFNLNFSSSPPATNTVAAAWAALFAAVDSAANDTGVTITYQNNYATQNLYHPNGYAVSGAQWTATFPVTIMGRRRANVFGYYGMGDVRVGPAYGSTLVHYADKPFDGEVCGIAFKNGQITSAPFLLADNNTNTGLTSAWANDDGFYRLSSRYGVAEPYSNQIPTFTYNPSNPFNEIYGWKDVPSKEFTIGTPGGEPYSGYTYTSFGLLLNSYWIESLNLRYKDSSNRLEFDPALIANTVKNIVVLDRWVSRYDLPAVSQLTGPWLVRDYTGQLLLYEVNAAGNLEVRLYDQNDAYASTNVIDSATTCVCPSFWLNSGGIEGTYLRGQQPYLARTLNHGGTHTLVTIPGTYDFLASVVQRNRLVVLGYQKSTAQWSQQVGLLQADNTYTWSSAVALTFSSPSGAGFMLPPDNEKLFFTWEDVSGNWHISQCSLLSNTAVGNWN